MDWSRSISRRVAAIRRVALVELPLAAFSTVLLGLAVISLRDRRLLAASNRVAFLCPPRLEVDRRECHDYVRQAVRSVDIAAEFLPGDVNCLAKSLVLRALLQHAGIEAELRIGVRTEPSGLAAHAWVEVECLPVNDDSGIADVFLPLESPVSAAVLREVR